MPKKEPLYPHVSKSQIPATQKPSKAEISEMLAKSMKEEVNAEVGYGRRVERIKIGGYPEVVTILQDIANDEHEHWLRLRDMAKKL